MHGTQRQSSFFQSGSSLLYGHALQIRNRLVGVCRTGRYNHSNGRTDFYIFSGFRITADDIALCYTLRGFFGALCLQALGAQSTLRIFIALACQRRNRNRVGFFLIRNDRSQCQRYRCTGINRRLCARVLVDDVSVRIILIFRFALCELLFGNLEAEVGIFAVALDVLGVVQTDELRYLQCFRIAAAVHHLQGKERHNCQQDDNHCTGNHLACTAGFLFAAVRTLSDRRFVFIIVVVRFCGALHIIAARLRTAQIVRRTRYVLCCVLIRLCRRCVRNILCRIFIMMIRNRAGFVQIAVMRGIIQHQIRIGTQAFHIAEHIHCGAVALVDVCAHRVHDNFIHRLRNFRHNDARYRRHRIQMLHDNRNGGVAAERQGSGQHLIHHNAQRIQVRAEIDRDALCLLRRDIVHGANRLR